MLKITATVALSVVLLIGPDLLGDVLYTPGGTIGTSSTSYIGVGTSTPAFQLDINGRANASAMIVSGKAHLSYYAPSDEAIVGNLYTNWASSIRIGPNSQSFWVGGGHRLWVLSSGKVGIGTPTPGAALHVLASSPQAEFQDPNTGAHLTIKAWDAGGGTRPVTFAVSNDGSAASDVMTLLSNGNVGIKTALQTQRLTLYGNIKGTAALDGSGGEHPGYLIKPIHGSGWKSGVIIGSIYEWQDQCRDELTIKAGKVGINTTSPTHPLSVNGTIRAKEVIVDTGWADYVFAEDYRLAPLSEVEAHIKEHKHLPDIPSAAEVAEQGVSMGEMQARMMAKIEELTLHVIAQEKRAVTQEQRIQSQQDEIAALRRELARVEKE